jgi:hypothetical protein
MFQFQAFTRGCPQDKGVDRDGVVVCDVGVARWITTLGLERWNGIPWITKWDGALRYSVSAPWNTWVGCNGGWGQRGRVGRGMAATWRKKFVDASGIAREGLIG